MSDVGAGVLLLAAGASSRFGGDKRRARLADGQRLIDRMLAIVHSAGLPVMAVLPAGDALLTELTVPVCEAVHAAEGMGASIADGVRQIPSDWSGCLILPVDLPLLSPQTLKVVAESLQPGTIVQPVCGQKAGHPVAFAREFYPELLQLNGDAGAKYVLKKHSQALLRLAVTDPGIYQDVDTREAFKTLGL